MIGIIKPEVCSYVEKSENFMESAWLLYKIKISFRLF